MKLDLVTTSELLPGRIYSFRGTKNMDEVTQIALFGNKAFTDTEYEYESFPYFQKIIACIQPREPFFVITKPIINHLKSTYVGGKIIKDEEIISVQILACKREVMGWMIVYLKRHGNPKFYAEV